VKTSKVFQIHTIIATVLGSITFVAWLIQAFMHTTWPWFLYVWAVLTISLSFHFYILEKSQEFLQFHCMTFVTINLTIFTSWVLARNYERAWFLDVFFVTGLILGLHYCKSVFKTNPHKNLYYHITIFTFVNFFCFTFWLDSGKGSPWFLYILFLSSAILTIHWHKHFQSSNLYLKIHVAVFSFFQITLFMSWAIGGMGIPWFFFPFLLWGIILGIHYGKIYFLLLFFSTFFGSKPVFSNYWKT